MDYINLGIESLKSFGPWSVQEIAVVLALIVLIPAVACFLYKIIFLVTLSSREKMAMTKIESDFRINEARQKRENELLQMKAKVKLGIAQDKMRSVRLDRIMSRPPQSY